jgi:hypothetical protein
VRHSDEGLVSKEELTRMASKLKEDLIICEAKLGSHRDLTELWSSANALIRAILEPGEFRLSASPPMKPTPDGPFTRGRKCVPGSLH